MYRSPIARCKLQGTLAPGPSPVPGKEPTEGQVLCRRHKEMKSHVLCFSRLHFGFLRVAACHRPLRWPISAACSPLDIAQTLLSEFCRFLSHKEGKLVRALKPEELMAQDIALT